MPANHLITKPSRPTCARHKDFVRSWPWTLANRINSDEKAFESNEFQCVLPIKKSPRSGQLERSTLSSRRQRPRSVTSLHYSRFDQIWGRPSFVPQSRGRTTRFMLVSTSNGLRQAGLVSVDCSDVHGILHFPREAVFRSWSIAASLVFNFSPRDPILLCALNADQTVEVA